MKYRFIAFLLLVLGCNSEQKKLNDISDALVRKNWPRNEPNPTHFNIDTLRAERIEMINRKELIGAVVGDLTLDSHSLERTIEEHSKSLKLYQRLHKYYGGHDSDIVLYTNLLKGDSISIKRLMKEIDSFSALPADTTKNNYLILAYVVSSSTFGRSSYRDWYYADSDLNVWSVQRINEK